MTPPNDLMWTAPRIRRLRELSPDQINHLTDSSAHTEIKVSVSEELEFSLRQLRAYGD